MPVTRSKLTGGPAYAAIGATPAPLFFGGDSQVTTEILTDVITSSLYGEVDEIYKDMTVKAGGTPLFYDPALNSFLFPYGGATVGTVYPGGSDVPVAWNSVNNDVVTINSALVIKPPELELGIEGPILGRVEIVGVIPNGDDPSTANAYYAFSTGSYSAPAVPSTALIGRQEFIANWGASGFAPYSAGFSGFQAQDKWTISHELKLDPVVIQGRIRAFRLVSYRAMAKCKPLGPTMAQIESALVVNNVGKPGGYRLSGGIGDLVISPLSGAHPTVTLGSCALKTAGYMFGGKPLRQGELGWVTTYPAATGNTGNTPTFSIS